MQGKVEGCSLVHLFFRPDAAAMAFDNPLNYGQAHSGKLLYSSRPWFRIL